MPVWLRYVQSLCLAGLSLAALGISMGSLSGCTTTVTSRGVKGDIVTESDETDVSKRARVRLELALGYYNNGQTEVALDNLKQSIAVDPHLFEAHNLRGLIYMRLNDVKLAESSFRDALDINPRAASVQHNLGWLLCQQGRYSESVQQFSAALANPAYTERAKTLMAQGLCQVKAGQTSEGEISLTRSYELDPNNPITGYNLANLNFQRHDYVRALTYVRRINNSELANAESLWLGAKVERQLGNLDGVAQLGAQLKKRFPVAAETAAFERGAFNE